VTPSGEQRVQDFERAWRGGEPPAVGEFAAGADAETVRELVALDLEYRWRRHGAAAGDWLGPERPPAVEGYARQLAGLDVSDELIAEEYRARRTWGDRPGAAEYRARFPDRPHLPAGLARTDAELAREANAAPPPVGGRPAPDAPAAPATRIGPYRVGEKIAGGATGTVYAATHAGTGGAAAVKVIHPHLLADAEARNRFDREARLLVGLDHPNVVRALAVEQVRGRSAVVMERVEGTDLGARVRGAGPMPVPAAAAVLAQMSEGLAYLHACGVAHRDVSPSNAMLSPDGRVRLIDFGLAKRAAHQSGGSAPGGSPSSWVTPSGVALFGTPDYVAPEAIRDNAAASPAADVYGLGGVAYFLLTGSPPFPAGSPLEKLFRHLAAAPPDVGLRCPDAPPALRTAVARCLAKSPGDRPTAAELAALFRQFGGPS